MALTPEMVIEAIKTSHAACEKGCIHCDACAPAAEAIATDVAQVMANGPLGCYYHGLHVGYRLRQLEEATPVPMDLGKVN